MSEIEKRKARFDFYLKNNISAKWSHWLKFPTLTIVEAVALSLGIEPDILDKIRRHLGRDFNFFHSDTEGSHLMELANHKDYGFFSEYNSRLTLAYRYINSKSVDLEVEYISDSKNPFVRLGNFCSWAQKISWDLPDELMSINTTLEKVEMPQIKGYFDRSDFPPELKVAFLAWVAIAINNECPDKSTPKQRLEYWITSNYPDYSQSVVSRVSTVANWMKEPGRTKKDS